MGIESTKEIYKYQIVLLQSLQPMTRLGFQHQHHQDQSGDK